MSERNSKGALKDCPSCKGEGFVYSASLLKGGSSCPCTESFLRLRNLDKVWESLGKIETISLKKPIPSSLANSNCWITSSRPIFQQYLRNFILNQPHLWTCKVRTDAELLDAWFGTAKAQGVKIYDLDVEESSIVAMDIRDLVLPPDLCVIWLGVKTLPNKEAPNSLIEAINYRVHIGKPTWVVDQPTKKLDGTHLYFSRELEALMKSWPHLTLSKSGIDLKKGEKKSQKLVASKIKTITPEETQEESQEEEIPEEPLITSRYCQELVEGIAKREEKRRKK